MEFVAEASRVLAASPEEAFDRLADRSSWPRWMPLSFRPLPDRAGPVLAVGARPRVRIAGIPAPAVLRVSVYEHGRELAWTGGTPGMLFAEHRFLFEREGEGTRVRSIETWSGALASSLRPVVQPLAERIGKEQLDALARSLEG